jgi:phosphatidylglycerol:prolipoprotein diacylglycerol transferase
MRLVHVLLLRHISSEEENHMLTIDIAPILAHLGALAISWYGLAVAAAIGVGIWLTLREAQRKGMPSDPFFELIWWSMIGGIVGARLLYVTDQWAFFAANPAKIFAVHTGGLSIMGAILGGGLIAGTLAWRNGLPIRRFFDAAAPGLILGQAIGRFGCLITGDTVGHSCRE